MKTCNQCNIDLVEGAKYCHQCGIPVLGKYAFISEKRTNTLASIINEIKDLKKQIEEVSTENKHLSEEMKNQWTITTSANDNLQFTDGNIGIGSNTPSVLLYVSDSDSNGNNTIHLGD